RRWLLIGVAASAGLAAIFALALWISLPDVTPLITSNPASTAFIDLRRQEALEKKKPFALKWTWRPLPQISPFLRRAVLHSEDGRFFEHEGVDWEAVRESVERNWHKDSIGRGASTITQQVAKNLYLSPKHSYVRKFREMFIAWRLEAALEKDRILEIYL